MSSEEIIRSWKNDVDPEQGPDRPLANPAGDQELSDEDLEAVEGGMANRTLDPCSPLCMPPD